MKNLRRGYFRDQALFAQKCNIKGGRQAKKLKEFFKLIRD